MEYTVALFIKKTYEILENQDYDRIIRWLPSGKEFAIVDVDAFEQEILPAYFRHRNIHSFIRQLNMYDFHKSRKDPVKIIFAHDNFHQGRADLLPFVRRKIKNEDKLEQNPELQKSLQMVSHHNLVKQSDKSVLTERHENHSEPEISTKQVPDKYELNPIRDNYQLSLQSMICPSSVLNGNPEMYSNLHENYDNCSESEEDNLSIDGEIKKEKRIFQNRTSGVSLVLTRTLLQTENHLSNSDI